MTHARTPHHNGTPSPSSTRNEPIGLGANYYGVLHVATLNMLVRYATLGVVQKFVAPCRRLPLSILGTGSSVQALSPRFRSISSIFDYRDRANADSDKPFLYHLTCGNDLFSQGNMSAALSSYDKALRERPNSIEALTGKAGSPLSSTLF